MTTLALDADAVLAPVGAAARAGAASRGNAVSAWKRQVRLFAWTMSALIVVLAAGSAGAMWHVLSAVAQAEEVGGQRTRAATAARLAVLEIDRLLANTVAQDDQARLRAAAVASIAAASRLEDAVTELVRVLPGPSVREMAQVVEAVKAPRVDVIMLARKGERTEALQALAAIAAPLARIDALSAAVLQEQGQTQREAARQREQEFRGLLYGLSAAALASIVLVFVFHRRLMQRFARSDQVERLLEQVAHSAGALQSGGRELDDVNREVQTANQKLRGLLERFETSSEAITREAERCVADLQNLTGTCRASASASLEHAAAAAAVAERIRTTGAQMARLLESTEALVRSCSVIDRLAGEIRSISATTRLLSLNAAVEAARAGSAGRSFGIIAASVRELSDHTQAAAVQIARASEEIGRQLAATTEAVRETGALMGDCAERVGHLDASARSSHAVVDGVAREVQGFGGSFRRQVEVIGAMEDDSKGLVQVLREGQRHAQLLDATSRSMAGTSAALHQRLATLQA